MEQETNTSKTIGTTGAAAGGQIPDRLYFRIGDVAEIVGVKPYVLRYWESEFPMISPEKSSTGQRVYRRGEVESLLLVKHLLYQERYSIEGARRRLRELRRDGELKTFKQEKLASALATSAETLAEEVRQNEAAGPSALVEVADHIQAEARAETAEAPEPHQPDEYIEVRETADELEIVQFTPSVQVTFEDDEEPVVVEARPEASAVSAFEPEQAPQAAAVDPTRLARQARMSELVLEIEELAAVPASRFFPSLSGE